MNHIKMPVLWLWVLFWTRHIYCSESDASTPVSALNTTTQVPPQINKQDELKLLVQQGLKHFTVEFEKVASKMRANSHENTLFAPVNVAATLAVLLLGADGSTASQIKDVIYDCAARNIPDTDDKNYHSAFASILDEFLKDQAKNPGVNVSISNAMFVQKGVNLQKDFTLSASEKYHTNSQIVDFQEANDTAASFINQWVKNATSGIIDHLVEPPLSPDTRLITANALLFNGEWEFPFLQETSWENFYLKDRKVTKVKMMTNKASLFTYYSPTSKYDAFGIPYKQRQILTYIVLPHQGVTLDTILESFTSQDIQNITSQSELEQEVFYQVPYMQLENIINLKKVLQEMGVKAAFDPTTANLTKIGDNLFLSDAIHKVNLEVTEAGSTGAAATSLSIETRFPERGDFIVNKPFLFFIYHKTSDIVLFWGTINLPVPNNKP